LVIERELERDIYANLAHRSAWNSFKKLRQQAVPISMVAGSDSAEMRLAGAAQVKRLFAGRWKEIDAGHLLPFEKPVETAQAIAELLQADHPVRRATQTVAP
jgi:pimeloyl-ACP methyl ester carboxylesterase